MKTKRCNSFVGLAVFALLLLPAGLFAEDKPAEEQPAEHGMVEFGVRYHWGDVYGRPDLQLGPSTTGNPLTSIGCLGCGTAFSPSLSQSKYEEYRDLRNGFFLRRFNATVDNVFGSRYYVNLQSQKTLYRDQSYLATFGQYGKFKVQFRYDETPHIYSDTTRTDFTETAPGVWSFPTPLRQTLQATAAANLPSFIAGTGAFAPGGASCPGLTSCGLVTDFNFLTLSIIRKAGTASVSYNVTPDLNFNGMFWRESQNGLRPIGLLWNSSPSASATAGYGVEIPETISYFNNLVRIGGEYGKRSWAVQTAFVGSFFQNNISQMLVDNPFNFSLVGAATPQRAQMDLYPNNQAYYLNFAGATDLGKWVRLMASINPGWRRQNDAFLPYTTNTALGGCQNGAGGAQPCTAPPAAVPSLRGDKQTLAMNYTLVTLPWKSFQIKAAYRHYDYNNNTPVHTFTPTQGDSANGTATDNGIRATSFNRKDLELTGNWYFAKRSSAKVGYEGEWMDRSRRDASHSLENSVFGAVDVNYWKSVVFRASYRHSDRKPDFYHDVDTSTISVGGVDTGVEVPCTVAPGTAPPQFLAGDQPCSRRFDETARTRDRADGLVQYSPTDKLTLSAFGGTIQDDYNRRGDGNSLTPLNYLTGANATTSPYYLYGILKDISYNYGFGADYAVSPKLTMFAEYSHEHYYRRLISRYRAPQSSPAVVFGGDTNNNDWESTTPEKVDVWTVGADTYVSKKVYFTTYYSLTAGIANTFSRFLGVNGMDPFGNNCANSNATSICRFLLVGASAASNYPESFSRQHEIVAVFKYKLTKNLWPKLEYRYQQFDYKDQQTSAMTQYMGCVSGAGTPGSVAGCPVAMLTSSTSAFATPVPASSPFYPNFVVGDTSAARYLYLGVDQPSYHAHYLAASMEYHF